MSNLDYEPCEIPKGKFVEGAAVSQEVWTQFLIFLMANDNTEVRKGAKLPDPGWEEIWVKFPGVDKTVIRSMMLAWANSLVIPSRRAGAPLSDYCGVIRLDDAYYHFYSRARDNAEEHFSFAVCKIENYERPAALDQVYDQSSGQPIEAVPAEG